MTHISLIYYASVYLIPKLSDKVAAYFTMLTTPVNLLGIYIVRFILVEFSKLPGTVKLIEGYTSYSSLSISNMSWKYIMSVNNISLLFVPW